MGGHSGTKIRVLIADDHPMVRQGLRVFLELEPDLEVVGEASDGAEAAEMTAQLLPDVVLLDLVMPGDDGNGFDPEAAGRGLGLVSMRERADSVGGRLTVTTREGKGTTIELEVPGGRS